MGPKLRAKTWPTTKEEMSAYLEDLWWAAERLSHGARPIPRDLYHSAIDNRLLAKLEEVLFDPEIKETQ